MPSSLVEDEDGMCALFDLAGDFGQVEAHRFAVAGRHDERCALALLRADGTEDVGRGGALISWCRGTGAAPGPTTGDLVLLADARLVGEPDLYAVRIERLVTRDFFQARREAFLKSSIAPSAWA
jgi:hypothetical protein